MPYACTRVKRMRDIRRSIRGIESFGSVPLIVKYWESFQGGFLSEFCLPECENPAKLCGSKGRKKREKKLSNADDNVCGQTPHDTWSCCVIPGPGSQLASLAPLHLICSPLFCLWMGPTWFLGRSSPTMQGSRGLKLNDNAV